MIHKRRTALKRSVKNILLEGLNLKTQRREEEPINHQKTPGRQSM